MNLLGNSACWPGLSWGTGRRRLRVPERRRAVVVIPPLDFRVEGGLSQPLGLGIGFGNQRDEVDMNDMCFWGIKGAV